MNNYLPETALRMAMSDVEVDLGDQYDKPVFDISWLDKPDKYDIDLGDMDNMVQLTPEDAKANGIDRVAKSLKEFLNK